MIQTHVALRRIRKGLLGDLSSLVKSAKNLQAVLLGDDMERSAYEFLDELVTKALKLVYRAVRFLDIWTQESEQLYFDQPNRPLTPPKDASRLPQRTSSLLPPTQEDESMSTTDIASEASIPHSNIVMSEQSQDDNSEQPKGNKRISFANPPTVEPLKSPAPSASEMNTARLSVMSHRLSYTSKASGSRNGNLASEQLCAAHDSFLGFIGSFIGLHLQSRTSTDFLQTTQQSVNACRKLLAVLDSVWERDGKRSEQLKAARDAMHARLMELVQAMRDLLSPIEIAPDETVFLPDQGQQIVTAATNCVRSAADCVTKTRAVIEKIGDFEFEPETSSNHASPAVPSGEKKTEPENVPEKVVEEKPLPHRPESTMLPPPLSLSDMDSKPLPEPPTISPASETSPAMTNAPDTVANVPNRFSRASLRSLAQLPIPQMPPPELCALESSNSPATSSHRSFGKASRTESVNVSVTDSFSTSFSTYPNSIREDGASITSRTSTRATTPDMQHQAPELAVSEGLEGSTDTLYKIVEDDSSVEEQLLTKTYVHELIHNREGQISGGSLPALIEQLTTNDTTPDAMFVTTFYLTFRLFTTPLDFAKCLIDRFEYVGNGPDLGTPVRLRVFNVFKGWLESHWQPEPDASALGVILTFATGKLRAVLPAAGKRLAELTVRVTEMRAGSVVPRLVSSLGKTSTSSTIFSAVEGTAPTPNVSRSQLNSLKNVTLNGGSCSILDFDPLEIARQLTLMESRLFCTVQPEELLLSESEKKEESKGTTLKAISRLSTELANFVADTILSLEEAKKRALVIKQWVKVSSKCLELNNYESLMAIVWSLHSAMVLRLKRTWELVSQKTKTKLDELESIISQERNWHILRARLQNHVAPCIPYVGIYLTDLTFNHDGNQNTRQLASNRNVSVINFDKHMRTAKIIGQLQSFQVPYRLTAVPEMQDWLNSELRRVQNSEGANPTTQYRRSMLLEPRQMRPKLQMVESSLSVLSTNGKENVPKEKFDFLSLSSFHFTSSSATAKKDAAIAAASAGTAAS